MPSLLEAPRMSVSDIIDLEKLAGQPFGPFHQRWLHERAP